MINGTRYSPARAAAGFEVIVIGSGLGGLTAAALLAKAGRRVLVLERHYTAGGFTHSFKRRGYEWDVGVHYIGDVHKPWSPLRMVFDTITDGQLKWAKMDSVYDQIVFRDKTYDFVAGARNFREELLRSFPKAGPQIDAYLAHIRRASQSVAGHFGQRLLPQLLQRPAGALLNRVGGHYFQRSTHEVLSDCVSDPKLAGVLAGQWGDYGLTPRHSSFAMHGVVAQHYLDGGNFPVGGASQIAATIIPLIEAAGGAVLVDAEVSEILVRQGKVAGVRMANGDEITAPQVISAVGVHNTFGRLLADDLGTREKFAAPLQKLPRSVAHLGLYIGLKGSPQELGLKQANQWVYRDYDHDAAVERFLKRPNTDFPLMYLSFPAAKDPMWASHYPGKSTIDVITLAPWEWFEPWQGLPWARRGRQYAEYKEQLAQKLLETVYRQVPAARGKVDYHELSTPLSTAHFNNYGQGEVYGLDHTPERFAQTWLKPSTPIKGLHLTGQDILFCGVASAMMSGVLTASTLLGTQTARVLPELFFRRSTLLGKVASAFTARRSPPPAAATASQAEVGESGAAPAPSAVPAASPAPARAHAGWHAHCTEVLPLTADTRAFRFAPPAGQPLAYLPGQYVTVEAMIEGRRVCRSYTLSSTPTRLEHFELTVKRVPGGPFSNWICDHLQPGQSLRMTGPHGDFSCAPMPPRKLLLLSAGSGITPMMAMARWLVDKRSPSHVVFFHVAKTQADILFREEIEHLHSRRFSTHISLTRAKGDATWPGLRGHLDAAMLTAVAPDFLEREVFICGPEGFMAAARELFQ
jgi:all-trans-retinol 13,14-reductase